MASASTIQIPDDVIKPIIEAKVAAAVMAAMEGHQNLVTQIVGAALAAKVDRDGKPASYGDLTFLAWAMQHAIKTAAMEAIREHVETRRDSIKAEIARQLGSSKSRLGKQLAEALVNGAVGAVTNSWRFTLELKNDR